MPRRILIVAAFAVLTSTAAVVVFGIASRSAGREELAEVLARHAAAGFGTSAADLAAMAPPVDRGRQERLYAWMRMADEGSPAYSVQRDLAWWRRDGAAPSAEVHEAHAAFRPAIEALETLFAEGDLCLTSLGWLPEEPESATIP